MCVCGPVSIGPSVRFPRELRDTVVGEWVERKECLSLR